MSTKTKTTHGVGKRDDGTLYALPGRAIPGRTEWLAETQDLIITPGLGVFFDDCNDGITTEVDIKTCLDDLNSYTHSLSLRVCGKGKDSCAFGLSLSHAGMIKFRDACAKAVEFFETGGLIGGPVVPATTQRPSARSAKKGGAK